MALSRFDPFADSMNLRQMMDRLFENAWVRPGPLATMGGMEGGTLALDVHETDNEVIVTTDIPGVRPEDLDVTIQGNVLRIQGEFKPREEPRASKDANETKGQQQTHRQERRYGRFYRELLLPASVKSDTVRAEYDNGVLTLYLPKAEEAKPRRIQIQSGGATRQIGSRAA